MNPFTDRAAAKRYAMARPYYHPAVIELIRAYLNLDVPIGQVLDVACGTGQSSLALKEIARRIIGVDGSQAMLAEAVKDATISYVRADAEHLPFAEATFDLITVSSAFHWFDQEAFLVGVNRLLSPSGWLVVYENNFQGGRMRGRPEFGEWFRGEYLAQFPSPPRRGEPLDEQRAAAAGFCFANRQRYANEVTFTKEALTNYLTTQSNIIAALDEGRWTLGAVQEWLCSSLESYFSDRDAVFEFGGEIWYLQKKLALA